MTNKLVKRDEDLKVIIASLYRHYKEKKNNFHNKTILTHQIALKLGVSPLIAKEYLNYISSMGHIEIHQEDISYFPEKYEKDLIQKKLQEDKDTKNFLESFNDFKKKNE